MKLAVELLRVTNKAISSCPFLLFQPLWTFAILLLFWVLWVAVLLSLGTAGEGRGVGQCRGVTRAQAWATAPGFFLSAFIFALQDLRPRWLLIDVKAETGATTFLSSCPFHSPPGDPSHPGI